MEILRLIRWQDILDILIVTVVIYRVLLIIKGTKAAQMLIGLGVFFLAFIISRYLNLHTLEWIIQTLWAQIVLALIILFQPEIRKALAQMGEARFIPSFTSAEELGSIEEIVKSSVALANRKMGALIAIERETSLKEFTEMGTPLDAKVSHDLLLSIFHPTSPIHDGAVIIKGNRIIAAGCFLPLSLGPEVSRTLGTRHKAALGLSEETDAVIIIVSEETGTISVAIEGRLIGDMDMGSLRKFLTEHFTTKREKKE
jgi:diadenylate cyclase